MEVKIKVHEPKTSCGCMVCPNCGAHELQVCNPPPENVHDWRFDIKGFKVDDWSHCLKCNCWFNPEGKVEFD